MYLYLLKKRKREKEKEKKQPDPIFFETDPSGSKPKTIGVGTIQRFSSPET